MCIPLCKDEGGEEKASGSRICEFGEVTLVSPWPSFSQGQGASILVDVAARQ